MELQLSLWLWSAESESAAGKLSAALMEDFRSVKASTETAGREKGRHRFVRDACDIDMSFLEGTLQRICKSPFRPH
jgi:peptide chain release factor